MPAACPRCSTATAHAEDFLGVCPKCLLGMAVDAPTDPERIGAYAVLGRLGAGGMGVVYRARHKELRRDAAVKLLAAGENDERFLREARAAARLAHPGIVPIFEVGRHEGRSFYAMELVDGESLLDRLKRSRPEPRQAAALLAQCARALDHAHRAGILHRDVKPSNIMLDREGRARIADFGVARDMTRETRATASGLILGTPAYMAPEQIEGDTGPGTDIYALGATLYECLTGAPPFEGLTPAALFKRVLDDEPAPPRGVPRDASAVCLKALAKKPADRYPSAAALADDLERFARGEPVAARAPGLLRAVRRHRAVIAFALAGLLAAALLVVWRGETEARILLAEARALTTEARVAERHRLLREARAKAYSPELRRQIDDALGRVDASAWLFLLVAGALPPSALDDVSPEARPFIERDPDKALAHDANCWRAWLVLAARRLRDDNPVEAREDVRRARLLAPDLDVTPLDAVIQRDPRFADEPPVALDGIAAALVPQIAIDRGVVRIQPESWRGDALQDVPPYFLPVRAWLRLMAEDVEGARTDLAAPAPAVNASAEWRSFVERVRRGVEDPRTPWVLLAQACSRDARGLDPAPKIDALLSVLKPGDPLDDFNYRRPALALRDRKR